MAGRKKLRPNALYFNLGLAIIWDALGLFFFVLSFFGVGLAFSVVLDFVAISSALLFRYLHKAFFFKTKRQILSEFRMITKAIKSSKKQALAKQYAVIRGQFDMWAKKGSDFIFREIIRILMTFLLELVPFLGDVSPTWTIKAHFELVKYGQQKTRYVAMIRQMDALKVMLGVEERVKPGIGAGGGLGIRGRQGRGGAESQDQRQGGKTLAGAKNNIVPFNRPNVESGGSSYQQQTNSRQEQMRYNETRSSGYTYKNNAFASNIRNGGNQVNSGVRATGGTFSADRVTATPGAFQSTPDANINVREYNEVSEFSPSSTPQSARFDTPSTRESSSQGSVTVGGGKVTMSPEVSVNGSQIGGNGLNSGSGVTISAKGMKTQQSGSSQSNK